jgi:hypothetical protein
MSQHEQDLTMDQTLITMALVFFTGEPMAVLRSSFFAGRSTQDHVSGRHTFIILFPSLCATAIWLGVVSSTFTYLTSASHCCANRTGRTKSWDT